MEAAAFHTRKKVHARVNAAPRPITRIGKAIFMVGLGAACAFDSVRDAGAIRFGKIGRSETEDARRTVASWVFTAIKAPEQCGRLGWCRWRAKFLENSTDSVGIHAQGKSVRSIAKPLIEMSVREPKTPP